MSRFVAYDVTRLLMRCAVPSPNGIDRVDLAYARHFVAGPDRGAAAGVLLRQGLQPALLDPEGLAALLHRIEEGWRGGGPGSADQFRAIKARLLGTAPLPRGHAAQASPSPGLARRLAPLRLLRPRALGRFLFARIPPGGAFVHTTHYHAESLFRWLARRRDAKPVFFIHDLLPLQVPEYFAPAHIAQHRRALAIFARYARAAIVNTHAVEREVSRFLRAQGRGDVPVLVRPIPPDPVFAASGGVDPDLADIPYFVVCGTIEPRKNHLMLLHIWRELSREWGARTPKLVVVGRRGWENENVVDLLDRSREIREHVIEVAGLPSDVVARLLSGARALLMPSFAEGYGLPIVEARAAGTPVIASDIAVFRETAPGATFRAPLDGAGWLAAIKAHAEGGAPHAAGSSVRSDADATFRGYFAAVEAFIASL